MKAIFAGAINWYARYERPVSSVSLVIGFMFEWFALKRIDLFWENFWVAAHFVAVAILMVLVNFHEAQTGDHKNASKLHFWYLTALQGLFGGMLSTFLVFYFRSAEISVSWPFILILLGATAANEAFKKHYERILFQLSLLYLSLFAFAIYIVPVILRRIGQDVFLISGFASLALFFVFVLVIGFFAGEKFEEIKKSLAVSVAGIFLAVNILYFFNIIPPIPLSLKDGGIYHSLAVGADGNYIAKHEDAGWLDYFDFYKDIHVAKGAPLYAYSAIFSPAMFNTSIVHEWQRRDQNSGRWVAATLVGLNASGGREGGWRTYSMKNALVSGKWRVNVKTQNGQVIGRLRFNVVFTDRQILLKPEIKN